MTDPTDTRPANAGGGAFGFVRNGYAHALPHDLTTADVENATVYGRDDETIGTISALKLGEDGRISEAVIEVGGFLGIGAHAVRLPFSDLTVLRETGGTDLRVHLDTTRDRLKAMPHHAG